MNSNDLLDAVYEYRRLVTRRDLMRVDLTDGAVARLNELEGVLAERDETATRRYMRGEVVASVQLHIGTECFDAQLIDLGAGGLKLRVSRPVPAGVRAIVRIPRSEKQTIYQFQVETRWGDADVIGMPFVGVPRLIPTGETKRVVDDDASVSSF